jgi:hypothetical protein
LRALHSPGFAPTSRKGKFLPAHHPFVICQPLPSGTPLLHLPICSCQRKLSDHKLRASPSLFRMQLYKRSSRDHSLFPGDWGHPDLSAMCELCPLRRLCWHTPLITCAPLLHVQVLQTISHPLLQVLSWELSSPCQSLGVHEHPSATLAIASSGEIRGPNQSEHSANSPCRPRAGILCGLVH